MGQFEKELKSSSKTFFPDTILGICYVFAQPSKCFMSGKIRLLKVFCSGQAKILKISLTRLKSLSVI
jgi:hypothetical protein